MEDNKMFDNRAVIRKLAEFNPDFKFFVVAPNGNEEITMYGVSEENFEVTENSVVINLSKSFIMNLEKEEETEKIKEEVVEEKKIKKNKKEEKIIEESETIPEQDKEEEAVDNEGDSEDSDSSDE